MTLEEYLKALKIDPEVMRTSGIKCPLCGEEAEWAERSLFPTNPPMQRLVCPKCEWSEVVPIAR